MPASKRTVHPVDVQGHEITLTNLGKVLYPETGFTKAQVVDYYVRAGKAMLPHLKGRPLNLKRYPHGVGQEFFFQKEAPANRPEWLATLRVASESRGRPINYCLANDLPSLVWLANTGNIEFHTFLARAPDVDRPTAMVFDLDPGLGVDLGRCCEVALWIRDALRGLGLASLVKVSGGKGMQAYVPLNTKATYDQTRTVSLAIAASLERAHPGMVTSNMRKDLRKGRVLIDYSQNARHKSTVCAYSLRAQPTPTVSAPLRWTEVEAGASDGGKRLRFGPEEALRRITRHGDLFADLETKRQRLPALGA